MGIWEMCWKTVHLTASAMTFLKLKAMTDIDRGTVERQNDKGKETENETDVRYGQGQKV